MSPLPIPPSRRAVPTWCQSRIGFNVASFQSSSCSSSPSCPWWSRNLPSVDSGGLRHVLQSTLPQRLLCSRSLSARFTPTRSTRTCHSVVLAISVLVVALRQHGFLLAFCTPDSPDHLSTWVLGV